MTTASTVRGEVAFRWALLSVLSCVTIINYVDRQALSILYPAISRELHLPAQTYTLLVTLFLVAYTVMYSIGGWLMDRIGTCKGLALALVWWSVATMLTGAAHTTFSLEAFRVMLALGQPLVFWQGSRLARVFLPQQRALATGIFSAGSGCRGLGGCAYSCDGRITCWMALGHVPARGPGCVSGSCVDMGLPPHRWLPLTETDILPRQPWSQILRQRRTWALVLPRAIGDPLWYFCLFWIPIYLQQARHLGLRDLALIGWVPLSTCRPGSMIGGSLSDALIRCGRNPVRARLTVIVCSRQLPRSAQPSALSRLSGLRFC